MGSALSAQPVPAGDIIVPSTGGRLSAIRHGGPGRTVRMVCGFLGCDNLEGNPIISTLPRLLKLDIDESGGSEWIRSTFQFAADELEKKRAGSATVLAKLSELLFVEAVRRYAEGLPEGHAGRLPGLRDPYVSRAMARLHADIARPWTVEALGREIGLSRAFKKSFGSALATWRRGTALVENA